MTKSKTDIKYGFMERELRIAGLLHAEALLEAIKDGETEQFADDFLQLLRFAAYVIMLRSEDNDDALDLLEEYLR